MKMSIREMAAGNLMAGRLKSINAGILHVIIFKESKWWISQGVEIDLCSQGDTPKEAKDNFLEALDLTLEANQERGSIRSVMVQTPLEAWALPSADHYYSMCELDEIPVEVKRISVYFSKIQYVGVTKSGVPLTHEDLK